MKVKLDENLGISHIRILKQAGHQAERLHEQGLSGVKDEKVWNHVSAKGYLFITLDIDFSDVRRFPPGSHPGILLIRTRSKGRKAVLDILNRVIKDHPLNSLAGCLVVADNERTRIRGPKAL